MAEEKRRVGPNTRIDYADAEGNVRSISVRDGVASPKTPQETAILDGLEAPVARTTTTTRRATAATSTEAPEPDVQDTTGPGAQKE